MWPNCAVNGFFSRVARMRGLVPSLAAAALGPTFERGLALEEAARPAGRGMLHLRGDRLQPGYPLDFFCQFALGAPGIISTLHLHPDRAAATEQLAEPNGDGRGYGFALRQDVVKVLAGDAEEGGNLRPALPSRRDHFA